MTDYTWFKLLVRAIGLLLIGMGLPSLLSNLIGLVTWMSDPQSRASMNLLARFLPLVASYGAQSAFGLYLFFGAEALISRCIRDVRGHCACCGYPVGGVTSGICPECGTAFELPVGGARSAQQPPP